MEDCIFCKIISGEVPSYKVYEDDKVLAFLDLRGVRRGHTLIAPKIHIDNYIDLPDSMVEHIAKVGNLLGRRMQEKLSPAPKRIGFVVAGFGVPHAHYHVIPMHKIHDITSSQYLSPEYIDKVEFSTENIPLDSDEEKSELVKLLQE